MILSNIFSKSEIVSNALLTSSPACSVGDVVEGGFLMMDTMSVAACFRQLVKAISGKETSCGKNPTVPLSIVDLVHVL